MIERIEENEPEAEELVISEFIDKISFIIRKHVGWANEDWKDLTHEVLLAMIQSLRSGHFDFSKGLSLESYIYGITRNKIRDYLKGRKRRQIVMDDLPAYFVASTDKSTEIEHEEARATIKREINSLKNKYKEVLYLRFYKEMSIFEISEYIGLPPRRVSERLHYALKLLKKRLKGLDISQYF